MNDKDWDRLIGRIQRGQCTPFLGAGASSGTLPLGADIAEEWAVEHKYPLDDQRDLARVAQYLAVTEDPATPKELLAEKLREIGPPDFSKSNEPHDVLAELPLPLYVTTNYDDFMVRALRGRNRPAHAEICKWNTNSRVQAHPSRLSEDSGGPTRENPVVFHLHGYFDVVESMVLTEDDYLDFLVAVTEAGPEQPLLPSQVITALDSTSLMFIGYSLADWDFRVLHRGLVTRGTPSLRRISVTVQLKRTPEAQDYVDEYFDQQSLSVFWGTAEEFCGLLRDRWRAAQND